MGRTSFSAFQVRVLSPEQCARMASDPLVLALANPDPEIDPEAVHACRSDAVVCTGRSDAPNQVNNVLCFPFIFRARWMSAPQRSIWR